MEAQLVGFAVVQNLDSGRWMGQKGGSAKLDFYWIAQSAISKCPKIIKYQTSEGQNIKNGKAQYNLRQMPISDCLLTPCKCLEGQGNCLGKLIF